MKQFDLIPTGATGASRTMRFAIGDASFNLARSFVVWSFSQRGSAINGDDLVCLHIDANTREIVLQFYHDANYNLEM
jgi:hypothetical protein